MDTEARAEVLKLCGKPAPGEGAPLVLWGVGASWLYEGHIFLSEMCVQNEII
jgi:hypothetical protein